jgi:hypothetical protein
LTQAASKHVENRRPDDHTNQVEKLRDKIDFILSGFPSRDGLMDSQALGSPIKKSRDNSKDPFGFFSPDIRAHTGAFTGSREDSEVHGELLKTPLQKKRIDNYFSLTNEVGNV